MSAPAPTAGAPVPPGAAITRGGVNFAVHSPAALGIDLCLFSPDGEAQTARLPLPARTGDIWHGHLAGAAPGLLYGLRAHGPFAPNEGQLFNQAKLLLDPFGRALSGPLRWSEVMGGGLHAPDPRDSAAAMPKSQVISGDFDWEDDRPPRRPWGETLIYEAHVKSLTRLHPDIPQDLRGTYGALGHPALIAHLRRLGVTTVELLPIHAFIDDRFVLTRGLTNHWGYNSIGFFAPEPRYGTLDQFKGAVKALHRAGIEVILDVVYNHSGEGDAEGPTLCFRGLDNAGTYRLHSGGQHANDAGTGNTLDFSQGPVLRMVLESLRYWVTECHIDGFRFDLATVLGRGANGFDPGAPFFAALRADPVLAQVKLIAEPWDIGPGGYQLGAFPAPFAEWNDRYRDTVRRFWRGDLGQAPDLARRLLGSAEVFDHGGRGAVSSVNFLTAHDGFTLADLASYAARHNEANMEQGRDGHGENHSDNLGAEGVTQDPDILAARGLRRRNLLATLLVSQGTPMLLSGDEIGHSQRGNNNAYAQDNALTWLDWGRADQGLADFTARLARLRAAHPALRQEGFVHSAQAARWRRADGEEMTQGDWQDPGLRCFGLELCCEGQDGALDIVYIVINGGAACSLHLPSSAPVWVCQIDTGRETAPPQRADNVLDLPAQSVVVFTPEPQGSLP